MSEETESQETAEELTLDQVFDEVETPEKPKPDAVEEEPEAEPETTGDADSEGENPDEEADSTPESEPEEDPKDEPWHVKAVMTEREKRQKAEAELQDLQKQLESKDEKPKTSVLEDEEGFRNELLTEISQQTWNDKLNMSQFFAEREFGKDKVTEAVTTFKELAESNADVKSRFQSAASPYHEMMKIVEQHNEAKALENIDDYKSKLRAELRDELRKEFEAEQGKKAQKREAISPSLASKRSTDGGVKSSGKELDLEDVLSD